MSGDFFIIKNKDILENIPLLVLQIYLCKNYKLANHFFPDLVKVHRYNPPTMATPTLKTKINTSIII